MIMNLIKRTLNFFLLIATALTLQSQNSVKSKPDSSNSTDSLPEVIKKVDSVAVDSAAFYKQKFEEETKKTAATSERIIKKVEKIPSLFNRAINTVMYANRVKVDAEKIDPEPANTLYPIITIDTTSKKKSPNRFPWFKRRK